MKLVNGNYYLNGELLKLLIMRSQIIWGLTLVVFLSGCPSLLLAEGLTFLDSKVSGLSEVAFTFRTKNERYKETIAANNQNISTNTTEG
jgi:hypothetical protein